MQFDPQRLSWPQIWPNSGTCASQHFLFFDNRRKIKSRKTHFVGRSPLSRLRRRFAPLRGTQRRCAALFFAPPGRYAPAGCAGENFANTKKKPDFKTLFAIRPFSPSSAAMRRRQATSRPRSRRHGVTAPCGHAMTGRFEAGASIHEAESCTRPD